MDRVAQAIKLRCAEVCEWAGRTTAVAQSILAVRGAALFRVGEHVQTLIHAGDQSIQEQYRQPQGSELYQQRHGNSRDHVGRVRKIPNPIRILGRCPSGKLLAAGQQRFGGRRGGVRKHEAAACHAAAVGRAGLHAALVGFQASVHNISGNGPNFDKN